VSRSGLKNPYQNYVINHLEKQGVNSKIWKGDALQEENVLKIISMAQKMGEIEGVFHLAMILKDKIFTNFSEEDFLEVVETKYLMAKHFDKLSRIICPNLEYFVVFSSIVSLFGELLHLFNKKKYCVQIYDFSKYGLS
jgi:fatty acid synthase